MAGCLLDNRDGCKGLGGSAVGYWGRDVYKRIFEEQEYAKQTALLRDQILAGSVRVNMWTGVTTGVVCSCYKESNKAADRKCKSCHGVIGGYVPGYLKFGYTTFWMSANDLDITLTNVAVTTDFKSAKAGLLDGFLTGTIESGDKPFTRTAIGSVWESDTTTFVRIEGSSTALVQYSTDSGVTWKSMSQLVTDNPASGTIRFKATLTRTAATILTPFFEMVRARYSRLDLSGQRPNGTYTWGPFIRLMTNSPYKGYKKTDGHGDFPTIDSSTLWTVGLSMFDPLVAVGSTAELISGPNVVFELLDGASAGMRIVPTDWQHSDPAGYIVVTQNFKARREDPQGPYYLLW